ncbi:zinc finger BED domain-containing protein RICESLEEPER 2 [Tanacetum coccineum]
MAYCKWCPAVFKADSQRHGTRHLNNHYPNCESNPDVEKLKKQKKLAFKKSIGEKDEGGTSSVTAAAVLFFATVTAILLLWSFFVLDILCIQVSTVASESAFSASGRVLDPYRNSLAPNIVEALVCTQDWIRTSSRNITMDTLEDLMKDDELAKEIQEGLDKQKGEQGQGREKNVIFDKESPEVLWIFARMILG